MNGPLLMSGALWTQNRGVAFGKQLPGIEWKFTYHTPLPVRSRPDTSHQGDADHGELLKIKLPGESCSTHFLRLRYFLVERQMRQEIARVAIRVGGCEENGSRQSIMQRL